MVSNLSQCPIGSCVVVKHVAAGSDGRGLRLEDLGFLVGTVVVVERRAALGDPTIYELRGMRLALRKADAVLVEVATDICPIAASPAPDSPVAAAPTGLATVGIAPVDRAQNETNPSIPGSSPFVASSFPR
jgi:ferrous iron transport protein A